MFVASSSMAICCAMVMLAHMAACALHHDLASGALVCQLMEAVNISVVFHGQLCISIPSE